MPRKKSDLKRMSVYLFPDTWDKCAALASMERIPVAMIIRRALTEYIERQTGESTVKYKTPEPGSTLVGGIGGRGGTPD